MQEPEKRESVRYPQLHTALRTEDCKVRACLSFLLTDSPWKQNYSKATCCENVNSSKTCNKTQQVDFFFPPARHLCDGRLEAGSHFVGSQHPLSLSHTQQRHVR